jgi:dCTP diphosphatase
LPTSGLDDLRRVFAELTALHGWAPLQTPRNLTLALTGQVGAVASNLQFAADDDVTATPELHRELADCLVYLVALTDALGFDVLDDAVRHLDAAVAAGRQVARE